VYELPGVDNAAEFGHTRHAMSLIGISEQQQEDVFRILSALLHLGNVAWEDAHHSSSAQHSSAQHSSSKPGGLCNGTAEAAAAAAGAGGCPLAPGSESPAALAAASKLMGLDVAALARALGTRTRITPDGPITSPLDARASAANRDALVKVVYARVFDWLVRRINSSIGQDPAAAASIGLLDIYGFESFQYNDLEQFCINLANEKLQQHFNQHVFKWEQVRTRSALARCGSLHLSMNAALMAAAVQTRLHPTTALMEQHKRSLGGPFQDYVACLHKVG
jgi:myosin-5